MSALKVSDLRGFRILSIDPGTTMLGVAVFEYDLYQQTLSLLHASTVRVDKVSNRFENIAVIHGERVSKLYAIETVILRMAMAWQPDCVVSESPFLARFPQAFAVLTECLTAIRKGLKTYDRSMPLKTIDPATIKTHVGVSGKSGDKSLVAKAVKGLNDLIISPDINLDVLDEHAIDAIAVGYAQFHITNKR